MTPRFFAAHCFVALSVTEAVVVGLLDVRAAHVLIRVEDVDVGGARGVGRPRDRAHERRVLDQRVDAQRLARLEVQAHLHGELRVRLEALVDRCHGRHDTEEG